MAVLLGFAFLAGIVTMLSPCILPLLPIILSGSTVGGKKYPFGVVTGFVTSFTLFTLFLSTIVRLTGLPSEFLRYLSIVIILIFGLVLVIPQLYTYYEILVSKLISGGGSTQGEKPKVGFGGGFLVGISLGLVWTPCVGPILASVIALALSGVVTGTAFFVTLAYSLGTALPMLLIMYGGRGIIGKVPWLTRNLGRIQRLFGVLLILVALAIGFNLDRQFQVYFLRVFPNYGTGLVQVEENESVRSAIDQSFDPANVNQADIGQPMSLPVGDMFKNPAPELIPGGQWLNSEPLTLQQLKGKVVLVDFWTYSCINCIRTFPYIQSWHEKYKDSGLVIIGVHTPEFEFEKKAENVAKAIADFGLTYAVMQDNDFSTWRAYKNRYWPAKYFIDAKGNIRDMHFGEGDYEQSEQIIRDLLTEAGYTLPGEEPAQPDYQIYSNTPETYLGYGRLRNFVSPEDVVMDLAFTYSIPTELPQNSVAYGGVWKIQKELARPSQDAQLVQNFDAREVFLVMSPMSSGSDARVEVFLDGEKVPEAAAGEDVTDGVVTVNADRLYKLIKLTAPGRHVLKLQFLDDNAQLYAFTFG